MLAAFTRHAPSKCYAVADGKRAVSSPSLRTSFLKPRHSLALHSSSGNGMSNYIGNGMGMGTGAVSCPSARSSSGVASFVRARNLPLRPLLFKQKHPTFLCQKGGGFPRGGRHGVFSRCFWGSKNGDDDEEKEKEVKKKASVKQEGGKGHADDVVEVIDSSPTNTTTTTTSSSLKDSEDASAVARLGDDSSLPEVPHVLVIPSLRRPLFPGVVLPITVTSPELSKALLALRSSGQPYVGVFLKKALGVQTDESALEQQSDELITDLSQIHGVGSFARIDNIVQFDDTAMQALLVAHRRIGIEEMFEAGPPMRVKIATLRNVKYDEENELIKAYSNEIVATLREVVKMNPLFKEHMQYFSQRIDIHNPFKLADFAASVTTSSAEALQDVLEELNCERRLKKALELITKELELSKVQQSIKQQVEEKVTKNQRRYLLMEQLKTIKSELGMEKDDKEALVAKYRDRMAPLTLPEAVLTVLEEELEKFGTLEKNSSEFNVTRNYLDWLTQLPWNKTTEGPLDLHTAKGVLDEDHFGLQDIKERILEFIAVSKLKNNSLEGKILCFVGPPGVGKTSIGKSVARALHREFYRFSVGGLTDVAEIKGHRRTYIGAMPGKIIQCLKTTQSSNPLILIDEIDKLGRGHQGDPASALLELLDPNQNGSFVDHYLDVSVDLSKVLFICTANVTDTIPGPLRDRMEILRLSGYDAPEKKAIAKQYLEPKARLAHGLQRDAVHTPLTFELTDEAIDVLIKQYCREAGVRNLEKHIEKIFRKVAFQVVSSMEKTDLIEQKTDSLVGQEKKDVEKEGEGEGATMDWKITASNLSTYVGKPKFTSDRMYDKLPSGVVMGLAWTAMGGSSLYIETTTIKRKKGTSSLITTGQMGNVMEESSKIAHTFARHMLEQSDPGNTFFDEADIHLHVPEGATPKDGPSAGCTMVTALLSLAMNRPVREDLAMTGEVSLTGKVLGVGGIKEKVIAARRAGVTTLVLPQDNQNDFEELPAYLKDGIHAHYADTYRDVFDVAFP